METFAPTAGDVLDLEWDPNNGNKLLAIGYDSLCWPLERFPAELKARLADARFPKVVFTKEDLRFLGMIGIVVNGPIYDVQVMAYIVDERTPLSLDYCAKHYLGVDPDKRIFREGGVVMFTCDDGTAVPIGEAPWNDLSLYNKRDLSVTWDLYHKLGTKIGQAGQLAYWSFQRQLSRPLLRMELNGLPIALRKAEELAVDYTATAQVDEAEFRGDWRLPDEFNLNSRDHMAKFLYTREFDLPARLRVTKEQVKELKEGDKYPDWLPLNFSVDKIGREYLHGRYDLHGMDLPVKDLAPTCAASKCKHESKDQCSPSTSTKTLIAEHGGKRGGLDTLIDYRQHTKALQFLNTWQEVAVPEPSWRGGRIHTHFKQTGTATGRLSSSDPVNLQNIPSRGKIGKEIRQLFVAPPGRMLVFGDYDQMEARLMAHYSQDKELLRIFADEGLDLYTEISQGILGERYGKGTPERELCKMCFLAMGYGAKPKKIKRALAEQGARFSQGVINMAYKNLQELFAGYWEWADDYTQKARSRGYVETMMGHRRHLDWSRENAWKAERQVVNSLIQGTASDITNMTIIRVDQDPLLSFWEPILQVHDELGYDVPNDSFGRGEMVRFQEHAQNYKLDGVQLRLVPIAVQSWGDAK